MIVGDPLRDSRLFWPADFAMTCGVVVPVDVEVMEEVLYGALAWLRHDDPDRLAIRASTPPFTAPRLPPIWITSSSENPFWS